jgi:DNA-binding CsgD family transcriptional regulator/tetratricopeptide (TPR) repeat protein
VDAEGFGLTIAAAQRWLPLGRDVLVRGDRGSGKSTVLERLLADASRRGVTGLLLRSCGSQDLSALVGHASASVRSPDEPVLTEWLADELRARRSILLVDDVDRVDAASLGVVRRVLARTPAVLVAASTVDPLRSPTAGMRELLVDRAPAELRVPPFGFRAVSVLLASVLGAPADAGLTSSVTAQTAGNPKAAVALVDAARAAGALRRQDGMWVEDGTLTDVPVGAVAYVFLSGMPRPLVEALEVLASTGPVPADVAASLVGPAVLAELEECGRVVGHDPSGSGEVLAVSPPVLARALRERLDPTRRRQLVDRVRAHGGPRSAATAPDDPSVALLATPSGESGKSGRAAQLTALVHERTTAEEAARRAEWLQDPTLARANAYLATLMRRPAVDRLEQVFERVRPLPDDDPAERATFAFYRSRWAAWAAAQAAAQADPGQAGPEQADREQPADPTAPAAHEDPADPDLAPVRALRHLKTRVLDEIAGGRCPEQVAGDPDPPGEPAFFRGWPAVQRAAALLEAGWPDAALRVCRRVDAADAAEVEPEARHYLAALRGQCLLQSGRAAEAERWQRRMLDAAYDDLDALGIRIHACVLAEVLFAGARSAASWRALSTALRLGAPGPVGTTFYRRGLTVGAVLQAQAGNQSLAEVLVHELDSTPPAHQPLLRSLRPLAHAALAAAGGDPAAASSTAWEAGRAYAEQGLLQPALLCWAMGNAALDRERAEKVRDVAGRTRLPLLDPYVRVLVGIAEDDREAVEAGLPGTSPLSAPGLTHAAEQYLGVGVGAPRSGTARPVGGPRTESLSGREQEVAVLAREGLSNRQIADQLYLSVRTVENHMSRALRKLGMVSRAELAEWTD